MIRARVNALERQTAARRPRKGRPLRVIYHYDDGTPDYESIVHEELGGEPDILRIDIVHTPTLASRRAAAGLKPIESMTDAEVEAEVREREARAKAGKP